ncbi:MAG: FCD domain-containing protein, partial [Actinomycetota bacterium]
QLIELMREGTWSKMKARTRADHEGAVRFLHEHEVILEAIIAGDPAGAEAAMRAHLNAIEQRFLEVDE